VAFDPRTGEDGTPLLGASQEAALEREQYIYY
jgi:hypothetical protein